MDIASTPEVNSSGELVCASADVGLVRVEVGASEIGPRDAVRCRGRGRCRGEDAEGRGRADGADHVPYLLHARVLRFRGVVVPGPSCAGTLRGRYASTGRPVSHPLPEARSSAQAGRHEAAAGPDCNGLPWLRDSPYPYDLL